MNLRLLLPGLAAGMAIGVLAFLLKMTQSVDSGLHQARLDNIRAVNNLDVELNRGFTQTRASSIADSAGDRARITQQLGEALDKLDKGPQRLKGLSSELDAALETFFVTVESKFGLGFDFEARNSILTMRLIAGLDAVPARANELLTTAAGPARDDIDQALSQLKGEIINFGVTPSPINIAAIREILDRLDSYGEGQSESYRAVVADLRGKVDEVITDKTELVDKLKDFLNRPTGPQLQAVEAAYSRWYRVQVAAANQYRLYLAAFAASLMLVLAYLGLRLRRSYSELDQANEHLEEQVQERTKDLRGALSELRESQAQLVQSEKMASLGQMVAGVAHEINTPLGYARSNAEIVRTSLGDIRELCSAQDRALSLMTAANASDEEVAQALAEADQQRQNINAAEMMEDLNNLLQDTDHGLAQIADLVSSLKDFSRVDRSRADLFDVNAGIESALKICHNQLKHRVAVERLFGETPQIECSPSQLNQVFLNLFTNAAQAIDGEGLITVMTGTEAGGVFIRITDTGSGMSDETKQRIFEPFFTTKPVGKGTGLGLSIVFRIIEEHNGRIEVDSTVGVGSSFTIHLPQRQPRAGLAETRLAA
ncbi:MAG: ATP-binding protein [Stagnimonas sp.]|nr:ATP-binding protein [Stagnimonas sp.]